MKLNQANLRDLEFICDFASQMFNEQGMTSWALRADVYRRLFKTEYEKILITLSPPVDE